MQNTIAFLGAPTQAGASQPGCVMGPDSFRTAGLLDMAAGLGWRTTDLGDHAISPQPPMAHANAAIHHLAETRAWIETLTPAAHEVIEAHDLTVFLGGDHSMSAGTIAGAARHAQSVARPLFVLWLDAHTDFHSLETTASGNLHGTPVAYVTGQSGFDAFPPLTATLPPENVCMLGVRSIDPAEHDRVLSSGVVVHDMRSIDEIGVRTALGAFLTRVRQAQGLLHVSFDVDFLDPGIAPAVGTTVPGGATFREAHLIMEMLSDSGLVRSLDLAELNPFLDDRGRTASLMVDFTASLLGRRVLDRKTRSFAA